MFLGLAALQDIADDARVGPIPPSLQLRALLALMALQANGDLQTYKDFWAACRRPNREDQHGGGQDYARGLYADIALNGICRSVGIDPQARAFTEAIADLLHERRMERCKPEHQGERGRGVAATNPLGVACRRIDRQRLGDRRVLAAGSTGGSTPMTR